MIDTWKEDWSLFSSFFFFFFSCFLFLHPFLVLTRPRVAMLDWKRERRWWQFLPPLFSFFLFFFFFFFFLSLLSALDGLHDLRKNEKCGALSFLPPFSPLFFSSSYHLSGVDAIFTGRKFESQITLFPLFFFFSSLNRK